MNWLLILWLACGQAPARASLADVPAVSLDSEDEDSVEFREKEPLPNFHQVSSGVYRSGQPSPEGLRRLSEMGIRTIINLRAVVSPEEKREARRLGMRLEHIPMNGLLTPTYAQVDRILNLLSDPSLRPILVHCRYGKDRTGYSVAAWQVRSGLMEAEAAAAEARRYGCCLATMRDLKTFLRDYTPRHSLAP